MQKLKQLRQHLLKSPLGIKGEQLQTFFDKGSLISHPGDNRHFEFSYVAHIILEDHDGPLDAVLFLLEQWLAANQTAQSDGKMLEFVGDILNHTSADLEFQIPLREIIKPETLENGDIRLNHCGEPTIDPVTLAATDWATYLNADPLNPGDPWLEWESDPQ